MLIITVTVEAPGWMAQGVKEHLAMCLERFGDTRVVSVKEADTLTGQPDTKGKGPP